MGAESCESNGDIQFEQPLEEETTPISPDRKIFTNKSDPEVDSLLGKWNKGKLVLQPAFQRLYVWDEVKASRLIESALLDIPLPIVYLSEDKDNKEYVIDGQQRLTSFFSFINGKFPNGKEFRLTGLKVYTHLNGKLFKEIEDEALQDKIQFYNIPTITFKKESDPQLRFEIFERLNTGSVALNQQELRNCIYRGQFNDFLKELATYPDFLHLLGLKTSDRRMNDVELVLRFAAFYHATYLKYNAPIKKFLNDEMDDYRDDKITQKDKDELRDAFKNTISIIRSLFDTPTGTHAFKRFYAGNDKNHNGRWEEKKFNASLYDVLMYTFAKADKNTVYQNLDAIREAFIDLMSSDIDFIASIELSTSSNKAVTTRFDKWRLTLQNIIGIDNKEQRCFSNQLKKQLFENNSTCAICGQQIKNVDDSAVDHITQYWQGGKTIPENARLTHRYCNWSRPRKDTLAPSKTPEAILVTENSAKTFTETNVILADRLLIKIDNSEVRIITTKLMDEIMNISNRVERRISNTNINFYYSNYRFCSIFPQKKGFCFEVHLPKNELITGNLNVTIHPSNQDWSYIHVNESSELSLLTNAGREAYIRAIKFSSLKN